MNPQPLVASATLPIENAGLSIGQWEWIPDPQTVGGKLMAGDVGGAAQTLFGISVPELLLGLTAVGGMLIGLWMMAGKPAAVPVPV